MSIASDARFWDRTSRKYAKTAIGDPEGYERTLDRTRSLLRAGDSVLELGCGTGTTALRLAGSVKRYLATDFSASMIAIADEKRAAASMPALELRTATVEAIEPANGPFNAILGFNYLHLVRDLPGTLRRIHALLADDGVFVSKTPCVGDMNLLIRFVIPVMRAIGFAPHAGVFTAPELGRSIAAAGFDIVATELHSTKANDRRPYMVARKAKRPANGV